MKTVVVGFLGSTLDAAGRSLAKLLGEVDQLPADTLSDRIAS